MQHRKPDLKVRHKEHPNTTKSRRGPHPRAHKIRHAGWPVLGRSVQPAIAFHARM